MIVGRLLLRPLFRLVAATGTSELFVAAILFVIVGTGVAAGVAGLSMALGAFVAGLLLAETEYRKAIETTIEPFKGLLLGVFFFTVGMNIDFRELAREPIWLLACVAGLIGVKAILIFVLARLFRVSRQAAIETGFLLGPGGEFAFVVIGLATALKLVSATTASFTLAVTSLTMALIPFLAIAARRMTARTDDKKTLDAALLVAPSADAKGRAIVVGHGRVGQVVCELLEEHKFPFIATDRDPAAVDRLSAAGPRGLLRRRRQPGLSQELRRDGCARRHRHHPRPGGHRRDRARGARDAAGHDHRLARARRHPRPPSLRHRRHRCGAGDHRSEPAALGSGARRPGRADRAGDRLHPREARRVPPRAAGSRRQGRAKETHSIRAKTAKTP